ncbi:hypothetical protein GCK32_020184, partial [Trichostrongylus colubriformis]
VHSLPSSCSKLCESGYTCIHSTGKNRRQR